MSITDIFGLWIPIIGEDFVRIELDESAARLKADLRHDARLDSAEAEDFHRDVTLDRGHLRISAAWIVSGRNITPSSPSIMQTSLKIVSR